MKIFDGPPLINSSSESAVSPIPKGEIARGRTTFSVRALSSTFLKWSKERLWIVATIPQTKLAAQVRRLRTGKGSV